MKSKSFDLNQAQNDKSKLHKTFDFVGYYKSESDIATTNIAEKRKSNDSRGKEGSKCKHETAKRERSPNKNKKKRKSEPVDISHISIDGSNLNSSVGPSTPRINPRTTSTPITSAKTSAPVCKVKSIMKTSIVNEDDTMDGTKTVIIKPKKRNKSVSFMLDDNDEVVVKRTKSDDAISKNKDDADTKYKSIKDKKKQLKNLKKECLLGKENKVGDSNQNVEKHREKLRKKKVESDTPSEPTVTREPTETEEKKKKIKKVKKEKREVEDPIQSNTKTELPTEPKTKKVKKTKHTKSESVEEPAVKAQKKDIKPDVIAEDLENLSIGDNAHTLSSLLDEMTVADKNKRIKSKSKHKDKKTVENNKPLPTEDEKERVIWKKRKWNKDKKVVDTADSLATSVIIENLPISIMLTYKKILADQFGECGLIKNIGLAEMYPTVESTPVFTTTINFYSDGAATQALEKDYMLLEGSHIRVKRPLPATETTLVLRTYGELTEQLVCSLLAGAGKIRSIRHVVKGKKATSTAFVEMDGPESVKKALKIATGAKIGGKKIYVSKFEIRNKNPKNEEGKPDEKDSDSTND